MEVQFITSFAVITADRPASISLYVDAIGLPLAGSDDDDYLSSEKIPGAKHFGVWPLSQAATACFGSPEWPADRTVPQASVEFEVGSEGEVAEAIAELRQRGFDVLHESRTEPWGQTVGRLQSPENLIVGISYVPSMHDEAGSR